MRQKGTRNGLQALSVILHNGLVKSDPPIIVSIKVGILTLTLTVTRKRIRIRGEDNFFLRMKTDKKRPILFASSSAVAAASPPSKPYGGSKKSFLQKSWVCSSLSYEVPS